MSLGVTNFFLFKLSDILAVKLYFCPRWLGLLIGLPCAPFDARFPFGAELMLSKAPGYCVLPPIVPSSSAVLAFLACYSLLSPIVI